MRDKVQLVPDSTARRDLDINTAQQPVHWESIHETRRFVSHKVLRTFYTCLRCRILSRQLMSPCCRLLCTSISGELRFGSKKESENFFVPLNDKGHGRQRGNSCVFRGSSHRPPELRHQGCAFLENDQGREASPPIRRVLTDAHP